MYYVWVNTVTDVGIGYPITMVGGGGGWGTFLSVVPAHSGYLYQSIAQQ